MDFIVTPLACESCSPPISSNSSDSSPPYPTASSLQYLKKEAQHRSNSEPTTRAPSFSRKSQPKSKGSGKSALSSQRLQGRPSSHQRKTSNTSSVYSSAIETPPLSPKLPNGPQPPFYSGSLDRDAVTARPAVASADSCANCSLSLPQGVSEQLPTGAPGSQRPDGTGKNGSPVLRTRDEYLVGRNGYALTSDAASDTSSDGEWDRARRRNRDIPPPYAPTQLPSPPLESGSFSIETPRSRSRRSTASSSAGSSGYHRHAVNYITSRHPSSPTSFSLLRSSCIRTLSCEQLPQTTSGPLYFGNQASGSTLAYIFRIPDPCALGRGRKRSYALILLGQDERRTMAVTAWVLRRFEALAEWIVGLAERTNDALSVPGMPTSSGEGGRTAAEYRYSEANRANAGGPVSALLSGRTTTWNQDGGFASAPRHAEVRAKGLAELCGKEDIFVELHRHFVCLLVQLTRSMVGGYPAVAEQAWDEAEEDEYRLQQEEEQEIERKERRKKERKPSSSPPKQRRTAASLAVKKRGASEKEGYTKAIEDGLRRQVLV